VDFCINCAGNFGVPWYHPTRPSFAALGRQAPTNGIPDQWAPACICLVRPLVLAVDVMQKGDLVCHTETNPMARYRDRLPQLDGRTFLTDGGLAPTLLL